MESSQGDESLVEALRAGNDQAAAEVLQRRVVDYLVGRRRVGQAWLTADLQCLQTACQSMLGELKPLARDVAAKEYFEALKFLRTLPAALSTDTSAAAAPGQQS